MKYEIGQLPTNYADAARRSGQIRRKVVHKKIVEELKMSEGAEGSSDMDKSDYEGDECDEIGEQAEREWTLREVC